MKLAYRCWAEIDLSALRENLVWIRDRVGPDVRIMTVVKADAYGHGLKQIAALLMQSGTDVFGVANLAEARNIRAVGPGWPVLMLGACLPDEVETAVRDEVMPTVSTLQEGQWFSAAATRLNKVVRLHVKVDTGMGRLGVEPDKAPALINQLAALPGIKVQGLYSHYSSVEDDVAFTRRQADAFIGLVRQLKMEGVDVPWIHSNSSGGLLLEPGTIFNLVRPGLLVYGVLPQGARPIDAQHKGHFHAALSFHCRVSLVKTIAAGRPISYGHTFVSPAPMKVATLTAGYGDGYLRAGSNRAEVLIRGKRCRIVGRITMDQMVADVTHVPEIEPGDEVALIGRQGGEEITATELAGWFNTIPWEVLTNITYRVPRIYQGGHAA